MIKYKGLTVITSNSVYLPAEDSFLAAEVLEECLSAKESSLEVLDMGTGTGLLGLVAAKSGKAKNVMFADINEDAVAICKENIAFNNAVIKAECNAVRSDLFSNVKGKFDIITFNAPYLKDGDDDKKVGKLAKAWSGGAEGIETSIKFLEESKAHLKKGGRIIIIASSLGNMLKFRSEIGRIGFKIEEEKKVHIFFEDIIALILSID